MYFMGTIMPRYVGMSSKDLLNSRESMVLEFWKNGKLKYRGSFKNDLKNGNFAVSYSSNGSLSYVGGYEDGKFCGKGICYWDGSEEGKFFLSKKEF